MPRTPDNSEHHREVSPELISWIAEKLVLPSEFKTFILSIIATRAYAEPPASISQERWEEKLELLVSILFLGDSQTNIAQEVGKTRAAISAQFRSALQVLWERFQELESLPENMDSEQYSDLFTTLTVLAQEQNAFPFQSPQIGAETRQVARLALKGKPPSEIMSTLKIDQETYYNALVTLQQYDIDIKTLTAEKQRLRERVRTIFFTNNNLLDLQIAYQEILPYLNTFIREEQDLPQRSLVPVKQLISAANISYLQYDQYPSILSFLAHQDIMIISRPHTSLDSTYHLVPYSQVEQAVQLLADHDQFVEDFSHNRVFIANNPDKQESDIRQYDFNTLYPLLPLIRELRIPFSPHEGEQLIDLIDEKWPVPIYAYSVADRGYRYGFEPGENKENIELLREYLTERYS